jgi:hypothetical protein
MFPNINKVAIAYHFRADLANTCFQYCTFSIKNELGACIRKFQILGVDKSD